MEEMEFPREYDWALCKVCHTRYIDRSSGNPNEYMCKECRAELKKLRIPKWLIACFSVVFAAAIAMCIYTIGIYRVKSTGAESKIEGKKTVKEAQKLFDENKQFSAIGLLGEYISNNSNNTEVILEAVRMAMDSGQYDSAAYFINVYLMDKAFTDAELYELQNDIDLINKYYDTYDALSNALAGVGDYADVELTEQAQADLANKYRRAVLSLKDNTEYEGGLIDFYYGFYLAADADDGAQYIASALDYPPATAYCAARLAVLERSNGNFNKADEWIKEGEKVNGEAVELVRAKATIALAKGEYDKALAIIEELYPIAPEELYVRDTYCVALYATGNFEKLSEILKEADSVGYIFDEEFDALMNGEITVRDYYVEGEEK